MIRKLTHDEISLNRATTETLLNVNKLPVITILDNIRSSYNVGSIFRTSDGAQVEGLHLCGYTPSPPKKEILKTALGSTESVKWKYFDSTLNSISYCKELGYRTVALELTDKSYPIFNYDKNSFPICLLLGNEITGISQDVLSKCDDSVEIPQFGIKQSLNVAVAYGIAIFELRRIFDGY